MNSKNIIEKLTSAVEQIEKLRTPDQCYVAKAGLGVKKGRCDSEVSIYWEVWDGNHFWYGDDLADCLRQVAAWDPQREKRERCQQLKKTVERLENELNEQPHKDAASGVDQA